MKILFIACYSPFINNSAAIETLQYLNKLSEINDNEVHLLSVNFPEDSIYYDKSLAAMINENIKIHLIDGGNIFNKLMPRKKSSGSQNIQSSNIKRMKLLRGIKNSIVIPDMYYGFAKNAGDYGKKLMEKEKFDVIFSMHEPPSSHLCAYIIKKCYRDVPWITYWSDPWLRDSTREKSFILKRLIEKRMEKKIVSLSDKFIFVTEENRNSYIKDYGIDRDKTFIITRGFDSNLFDSLASEDKPKLIDKKKINIIYAGEIFSKLRDINPFIDAINEIKSDNINLYNKINLMFFGNIDDEEAKEKLQSLDIAKVSKRIPFNEAIKYMLNSDILLLFGNKDSKQIPAKIYEYFGAKGKIFVIYGDDHDPIRDLVENNSKCVTTINSKEDIKGKMISLLEDKNNLLSEPDYRYEWETIVDRLNKILEV